MRNKKNSHMSGRTSKKDYNTVLNEFDPEEVKRAEAYLSQKYPSVFKRASMQRKARFVREFLKVRNNS
ncbi:MAG: hypothetical protein M1542_08325 [Thermotogae bacterium]|jgi:hypothetical protein|nr:hypothetical protein [Thermotogota bacterium]MCL5033233.1 hypothetical protein [Thermotogota bacterium]